MAERPFVVSTSDRILFKRCRRKWDFQSANRQALVTVDQAVAGPLWLGSGFHFALEDFHGYNLFEHPSKAFRAYVSAHRRGDLPGDHEDLTDLACGMLDYYIKYWLPQHGEPFKTLWIDNVPQVEVMLYVPLDIEPPDGYDSVMYRMTFDRVCIDDFERIIIEDYKTAQKAYEAGRLELDPQVSSYDWGGRLLYGDAVEGACWLQFIKALAHEPKVLMNGELSMNKDQYTTHAIYRDTLIKYYGEVPKKYIDFLNYLTTLENPEGDRYIRRELIYRNAHFAQAEERKIFAELTDMIAIQPAQLYPNPTRDCIWECAFKTPCLAMDDGSDYSHLLKTEYTRWDGEGYKTTGWRERLEYPAAPEFTASVD